MAIDGLTQVPVEPCAIGPNSYQIGNWEFVIVPLFIRYSHSGRNAKGLLAIINPRCRLIDSTLLPGRVSAWCNGVVDWLKAPSLPVGFPPVVQRRCRLVNGTLPTGRVSAWCNGVVDWLKAPSLPVGFPPD